MPAFVDQHAISANFEVIMINKRPAEAGRA